MRCRICGREGFDICPECQFKEQNIQCWRCRMYIPYAEMQQWRGQWICPNCRMDLEREEAEMEAARGKKREEGGTGESYEKIGKCDRCGRETMILYKFNNRNLCWYCLEEESGTDYSGAGGAGGVIQVRVASRRKRKKGLLERIKELIFGKKAKAEEEEETVISTADVIPIKKKEGGEVVPKKTEGATAPEKKEEKRPEKKERTPVVHKKPPEEEKEEAEGEKKKKKPDWGQWKED